MSATDTRRHDRGDAGSASVRFEALTRSEVTDDLIDRMLTIYARAFPRWPHLDPGVPLGDYLRWKMESPGCPFAAIAGWSGPRLVLARVCVLHRIRVDGVTRSTIDTPDLAVDPDFQGRGISTAGTAWSDRIVAPFSDLQIDEATNERVWKSRLRSDARPVAHPIRALLLVADPARFGRRLLAKRGWRAPAALPALTVRLLTATQRLRGVPRRGRRFCGTLRVAKRFDRRADTFFEEAAAPFDLVYQADRERLEWRYCDPRSGPFVVRFAEEGDSMVGYAVVRRGLPDAHLADLLALPGRDDVVHALARDAVEIARSSGAVAVSSWLPDRHPYRGILRGLGFLTRPEPIPLRYRGQRVPTSALALLGRRDARLHFVPGSTDLV